MNLTGEMKRRIAERLDFERKVEKALGIRPKMDVLQTNGTTTGKFDLRSLNEKITKR